MSDPAVEQAEIDVAVLLGVLAQVKGGDFTARMPLEWTGVAGKVADGLNEVILANQALGAELARVGEVVGKQGKLSQRIVLGGTRAWSGSIESCPLMPPGLEVGGFLFDVRSGELIPQ